MAGITHPRIVEDRSRRANADVAAVADVDHRDQGQFLRHAARAVRLRQDHDAAADRRLHRARPRHHRGRRPAAVVAGLGGAAGVARHGHGVPELRDLAAQERVRERRVRPQDPQGAGRRGAPQGRGGAGAGQPRRASKRRYPSELSGGQQQRVALARSLVVEPDILLLDEPLSNLDAKLRERMRSELKELQRRTGITFVYVTHDQAEALALSDQIAVMNLGPRAAIRHAVRGLRPSRQPHGGRLHGAGESRAGQGARDAAAPAARSRSRPSLRSRSTSSTAFAPATRSRSRSGRRTSGLRRRRRRRRAGDDHQPRLPRQYQRILRHAAVRPDAAGADPSAAAFRGRRRLSRSRSTPRFAASSAPAPARPRRRSTLQGATTMNKPMTTPIRGEEHWTNKGDDVRLFMWDKRRRSGRAGRHDPVRARLVHGVDSRPSTCRCRAAANSRRWIISPRAASTPGASTWRATAAPPRPRDNNAPISYGADDCFAGRDLHPEDCAATSRCWSTGSRRARCAPRCSRSGIPRW